MANQDEFVKTALRLPRELHTHVRRSAEAQGWSMNSEIIARLRNEGAPSLDAVMEKLRSREAELIDSNQLQISVLRNVIARVRPVLEQMEAALDKDPGDRAVAALKEKIDFCMAMIETIEAYPSE